MVYGALPFQQTDGENLFGGEPVAPTWKRMASAFFDYGIPFGIYLFALFSDENQSKGLIADSGTAAATWAGFLPFAVYVNSGLVQGLYGQSLGRWITQTTLVTKVGRRLEAPGPVRGSLRLVIPFLLYYFGYLGFTASDSSTDSAEAVGRVMIGALVLCYVIFFFDPKNRTVFEHLTRTAVVDVSIGRRNDEAFHPYPGVRRRQ